MISSTVREHLRRHVLGLLAILIALSGTAIAAGDDPSASTSVVTTAKFKKLKQRVKRLESKLNAPVSGSLTGVFPNLALRANSVGTDEIADGAIGSSEIASGSVTDPQLATNSVGGRALKPLYSNDNALSNVATNTSTGDRFIACILGDAIIGGGAFWSGAPANALLEETTPNGVEPPNSWVGSGRNLSGSNQQFVTRVLCLPN